MCEQVVGWRWCWVNYQCRGILLRITVGQGPTALAVGAGGSCLDIFSLICHFLSSFSLSLGDGPIYTELLSQRAVKPKTTNQATNISKRAYQLVKDLTLEKQSRSTSI